MLNSTALDILYYSSPLYRAEVYLLFTTQTIGYVLMVLVCLECFAHKRPFLVSVVYIIISLLLLNISVMSSVIIDQFQILEDFI